VSVSVDHQWKNPGWYNVTVHVRDIAGMKSGWSDSTPIMILAPSIEIEDIRSGIGSFRAVLKNTGNAEATNINWTIKMDKGLHLLSESTGTIASLAPGKKVTIRNPFVFGFGLPVITVEFQSDKLKKETESTTAFIIGPFIII